MHLPPYSFFSGLIMMGTLVTGLFFWKFWKKTYDKLFLFFSYAFFLMSFERLLLGYLGGANEVSPLIYLIRLGAYSLIIIAIYRKNKEATS